MFMLWRLEDLCVPESVPPAPDCRFFFRDMASKTGMVICWSVEFLMSPSLILWNPTMVNELSSISSDFRVALICSSLRYYIVVLSKMELYFLSNKKK